jgi:Tetrapyrrole (Corrin/Porphyrin) Methylases
LPGGSLTVVGTGIQLAVQVTSQARAAIERADEVLYLVTDFLAGTWIERLHPGAESLDRYYEPGKDRAETYAEIVERILSRVRAGLDVCAAFYGHPGVLVRTGHESIRRARLEGFDARMLPGVSAEDCLYADLGFDPGEAGCQSYEATSFLVYNPAVETSALLILWQIGFVGELTTPPGPPRPRLDVLADRLVSLYPTEHEAFVYEASPYLVCAPVVHRIRLADLAELEVPPMATLAVPPLARPAPNLMILDRLGMPPP